MLLYSLSVDECLIDHGPEYQCRVWGVDQENNAALTLFRSWWWVRYYWFPCPCTYLQALFDPRYMYVDPRYVYVDPRYMYLTNWADICFVSRTYGLTQASIVKGIISMNITKYSLVWQYDTWMCHCIVHCASHCIEQ